MKPLVRLALLALFTAGCLPWRYYPLPVPASQARDTFAPIATAASEHGWKYYTWPDNVSVVPDRAARITFMFDVSNNYVMCVQITDKQAASDPEGALAAGKLQGDMIWARAMDLRRQTAVAPVMMMDPVPAQPSVQIQISH